MTPTNELEKQVEAAYDYRGYVTVKFKNGETLEGFVFNREFSNPKLKEDPFIEMFPKDKDERKRYPISAIQSIELTGENCAETIAPLKTTT